jgi:hypothetical protein
MLVRDYTLLFFLITILVYRVQKIPFIIHHFVLAAKIKKLEVIAIIIYKLYIQVYILYRFSRDFIKCSKCTYKEVAYNRNFSKVDFNNLSREKAYLEVAKT